MFWRKQRCKVIQIVPAVCISDPADGRPCFRNPASQPISHGESPWFFFSIKIETPIKDDGFLSIHAPFSGRQPWESGGSPYLKPPQLQLPSKQKSSRLPQDEPQTVCSTFQNRRVKHEAFWALGNPNICNKVWWCWERYPGRFAAFWRMSFVAFYQNRFFRSVFEVECFGRINIAIAIWNE